MRDRGAPECKPIVTLRARFLAALARGTRALHLPAGLEWQLKRAFFGLARPLLRGSKELREFDTVAEWRSRPIVAAGSGADPSVDLERAKLLPADPAVGDVLVFGVIDWDFRIQRPQHLAMELARRGRRVFYLAPGFVPGAAPGFQLARVHEEMPIWQARLTAPPGTRIYDGAPEGPILAQLAGGLRELLGCIDLQHVVGILDHPAWWPLARLLPRATLVYDCMDHHHGFADSGEALASVERDVVQGVDALVVSSAWLEQEFAPLRGDLRRIRNGCDPVHFATCAAPRPAHTRACIGYFGAMAEWFDVELVREVAVQFAEAEILLVGADTARVGAALAGLSNVRFTGECRYAELPSHIAAMDVCLIPFRIDELTRATNPVKAYEALAAGKPVVATPLPELLAEDFDGEILVAESSEAFRTAITEALATSRDPGAIARRQAIAARHSWRHRGEELLAALEAAPSPLVSVIVITWNGVELSRRCVRSVLEDPAAPRLEVIVVDNASSDATPAWLAEIEQDSRVHVLRNDENRGFAAACNQGLAAARGELLVILNNDLVVTPGWTRTLQRHLREDPTIGLLGPVTNNIGNEARIVTQYRELADMWSEQAAYTGRHAGCTFELDVAAFFCVAIPRDVYAAIGGLDEVYGTGFFEDDDYAQRVRRLGRRIVCAEDVFVHHELSASFSKMDPRARDELFERNRRHYESKWGPWQLHRYRSPGA